MSASTVDVRIENHGSIMLFRVLTQAAKEWVAENVNLESWQWMGNGFSVEPRYAEDLAEGMQSAGLTVE